MWASFPQNAHQPRLLGIGQEPMRPLFSELRLMRDAVLICNLLLLIATENKLNAAW